MAALRPGRGQAMSNPQKRRVTSIRDDGKHRGKIGAQLGTMFAHVSRILDRFRRDKRQPAEPVERCGTRPKIAALSESRSGQPGASSSWPLGTTQRIVFQSLREAFLAHRRYEELRSKGIPHDTAIRQALGIPRVRP